MKARRFPFRPGCRDAAFSLVEVAIALGIVGFALVGIVGALPVAMNNGRLSIAQSRAAGVANTVFANFRAQSFSTVHYLDPAAGATSPAGTPSINLNLMTWNPKNQGENGAPLAFYAVFDEIESPALATDARRLHFQSAPPAGGAVGYLVVLRFDNNPAGTLAPYFTTPVSTVRHAQANAVEASVSELDRPKDVFRFDSVIASRLE